MRHTGDRTPTVLVTADEVGDDWLVGDELGDCRDRRRAGRRDARGVDDTAEAIADDGAAAVPPTLAQDVSNTVASASEASGDRATAPRTGRWRVESGPAWL